MVMNILYIFAGLFVFAIAVFKRDLLIHRDSVRVVLAVSIVLFFASLALHFTTAGRHSNSGALLGPLISLGWYRLCRRAFLRHFKREPRDTLFDWNPELRSDRCFNVVFFASTPLLVMLLAIGMLKLARAGW
jgi:hypothetical protein